MAYYMMYEDKKGKYEVIDITKSIIFTKESKYTKVGACSLKEIDLFTSMFNNSNELKKQLLVEGLIDNDQANKNISVREITNGKYKKVMYDMLYQDDLEYIAFPERIVNYCKRRDLNNDYLFLKELALAFRGYRDCSGEVADLLNYISTSLKLGVRYKHMDDVDKNGMKLVERMVRMLVFEYSMYPDGYIKYNQTVKYRNLHKLIAFRNNYNKKKLKREVNIINDQVVKKKTRKKERTEVEGQISLFDD